MEPVSQQSKEESLSIEQLIDKELEQTPSTTRKSAPTPKGSAARPRSVDVHPPPPIAVGKQHVFDIKDGQAQIRVYDTLELRAAFLYYCHSSIRPNQMHRMGAADLPHLNAQNLISMCKDLGLVEPQGPLPLMTIAIMYTTLDKVEDKGLTYAQFLDALMELAFECSCNVAGQLQEKQAARLKAAEDAAQRHMLARSLQSDSGSQLGNSRGSLQSLGSLRRSSEAGPAPPRTPTPVRRTPSADGSTLLAQVCRPIQAEKRGRFDKVDILSRSPSLLREQGILRLQEPSPCRPDGMQSTWPGASPQPILGLLRASCPGASQEDVDGKRSTAATGGSRANSTQRKPPLRPSLSIAPGRGDTQALASPTPSNDPTQQAQCEGQVEGSMLPAHPLHACLLREPTMERRPLEPYSKFPKKSIIDCGEWDAPAIAITEEDLATPDVEGEEEQQPRTRSISGPGEGRPAPAAPAPPAPAPPAPAPVPQEAGSGPNSEVQAAEAGSRPGEVGAATPQEIGSTPAREPAAAAAAAASWQPTRIKDTGLQTLPSFRDGFLGSSGGMNSDDTTQCSGEDQMPRSSEWSFSSQVSASGGSFAAQPSPPLSSPSSGPGPSPRTHTPRPPSAPKSPKSVIPSHQRPSTRSKTAQLLDSSAAPVSNDQSSQDPILVAV